MKIAKIGDLRNRLSYFLRFVRRGQSVIICDRDRAIARIVPVRSASLADETSAWPNHLIEAGVLSPPASRLRPDWIRQRPRVRSNVVDALLNERAYSR
jgi:antitoxin (DNA-binding transcriptional repressor) of toxin-antitoxin stability system